MKLFTKNIPFIIFCLFILALCLRGLAGNPRADELIGPNWTARGPFELSPERGRFALTYSVVEDKSVEFSKSLAFFAIPDLGYRDGKFVSLFAPAVSFIVIPGYLIGKILGASQLGTYFVISVFAVANAFLIRLLSKKIGASQKAATFAALAFLFATPAFSYSINLYQHHISTFLILMSLWSTLSFNSYSRIFVIFLIYGLGVAVDYPNIFLLAPFVVYSLATLPEIIRNRFGLKVKMSLVKLFAVASIFVPLGMLALYNQITYENPFQLSGTIENVRELDSEGNPVRSTRKLEDGEIIQRKPNSPFYYFRTRNITKGLYTHLVSNDRGVIVYAPIVLLGIIGFLEVEKKNRKASSLIFAVVLVNLVLYSLWGDVWGGWAFGSRYLIPSYSLMAIMVGKVLTDRKNDPIFLAVLLLTTWYSIFVNGLGALTTVANPPSVEAESLSLVTGRTELVTYERNLEYLLNNGTKSFAYNTLFEGILTPFQYFILIVGILISASTSAMLYSTFLEKRTWIELTMKTTGILGDTIFGFKFIERVRIPFIARKASH